MIRGKHIAIAGANYWPEATGIAPYTTGIAGHLARRGAKVTVLTAFPSYPGWRLYDGYQHIRRQQSEERGVRVRRFRSYVPSRQTAIHRAAYEFTFLANASLHRSLGRLDAVLGIVPTLSGGLLAQLEARRGRCRYGLIVQDVIGKAAAQTQIAGGAAVAGVTTKLEGMIARRAALIGVISEGFRPYFEELGVPGDRIVHVRNWTHIDAGSEGVREARRILGWSEDGFVVLHTGNMGLKQGLDHVVTAARLAESRELDILFVLLGDGNQRASLIVQAAGCRAIRFCGLLGRDQYPTALRAADVLLVNERASIADMSLPSKLTSYFSAGRPVIAAVPSEGSTAKEIHRAGAGLVVEPDNPESLLSTILQLRQDPARARRLGLNGAHYASSELSATSCLAAIEALVTAVIESSLSSTSRAKPAW